jgi:hypothetical protein
MHQDREEGRTLATVIILPSDALTMKQKSAKGLRTSKLSILVPEQTFADLEAVRILTGRSTADLINDLLDGWLEDNAATVGRARKVAAIIKEERMGADPDAEATPEKKEEKAAVDDRTPRDEPGEDVPAWFDAAMEWAGEDKRRKRHVRNYAALIVSVGECDNEGMRAQYIESLKLNDKGEPRAESGFAQERKVANQFFIILDGIENQG